MDEFMAQSYIVVDLNSGRPVLSENPELPLEAGSLTRLMTVYTVLTDPSFDPDRPVVLGDVSAESDIFVGGETISSEAALFATYYEASDAAARALVQTYGPEPEAFVTKMQQNAQSLGMTYTRYVDPLGSVSGSVTSAEDTVKLLQALNRQAPFRRLSELSAYLLPDGSRYAVSGLAQIPNPGSVVDIMSSDYLTDLEGLLVSNSSNGWSYGAGSAKTNDGRELLAVVLGAASKIDAIQGEKRAAQALRTLLEEGAKSLGVSPVNHRSFLSAAGRGTAPDAPHDQNTVTPTAEKVTENVTTTPETEATLPLALSNAAGNEERLDWPFYVILAVLVLALFALIVSLILQRRKRRVRRQRGQRYGAVRPGFQPRARH